MYKSTTRHIRVFAATIEDNELVPSTSQLTLDIDPDNELNWTDDAIQLVYRKFEALVDAYEGAELADYTIRRIGSDLEHYVRSLLQEGVVSYNLQARVRNFSLGMPRTSEDINV
ncbi:NAD(P)H-quinone oxidoreductase subunit M [Leptolyngbya sp. AN02str]|uniref:NAD(P)H-quinone oxidoreductase subunit M n=1 Tax=Leptolyngbya sp. AN02str TaxID=3423363 RepID=UPI003D31F88B